MRSMMITTTMQKKYGHESDPEYYASIVYSTFNDEDAHNKTPANYYFNFVA